MDSPLYKQYVDECADSCEFLSLVQKFCSWNEMKELNEAGLDMLFDLFDDKVQTSRTTARLNGFMSVMDMYIRLCDYNTARNKTLSLVR